MSKLTCLLLLSCALLVARTRADDNDLSDMNFRMSDDDDCRRHNNEGVCEIDDSGHYTCACLYHEKPAFSLSLWLPDKEVRRFSHKCERISLPFHEDTCKVLLGNPKRLDKWEFYCPNNGFLQTWGAFAPEEGSYHVRLWYRCCNVECPKWNCQWTPTTVPQQPFKLPLNDVYVQGVRAHYIHEKKDSEWNLQLCTCDFSGQRDEL